MKCKVNESCFIPEVVGKTGTASSHEDNRCWKVVLDEPVRMHNGKMMSKFTLRKSSVDLEPVEQN